MAMDKKPAGNQPGILSAYLPGQLQGISGPLSRSFGGTRQDWNGILSQPYSNMEMPADFRYGPKPKKADDKPDGGNGGNGNGGGKGSPSGAPPHQAYAPYGADNKVMQAFQAMAPQQAAAQPQASMAGQAGQQIVPGPVAGVQAPAPNQMFQQPQQQMLSPQVLAMLRQQFGGR